MDKVRNHDLCFVCRKALIVGDRIIYVRRFGFEDDSLQARHYSCRPSLEPPLTMAAIPAEVVWSQNEQRVRMILGREWCEVVPREVIRAVARGELRIEDVLNNYGIRPQPIRHDTPNVAVGITDSNRINFGTPEELLSRGVITMNEYLEAKGMLPLRDIGRPQPPSDTMDALLYGVTTGLQIPKERITKDRVKKEPEVTGFIIKAKRIIKLED